MERSLFQERFCERSLGQEQDHPAVPVLPDPQHGRSSKSGDRPKCGDCAKPLLLDRPVKVGGEDFERTVLGSEAPVLVDFYADWCAPCKYVAPLMDELAKAHEGTLLVVKVDTDQAPDLSQRFGIRGIPTLILFKDGEEVGRSVGFEPEKVRAMADEAVRPG
jgi:thioredoxin